MVFKTGAGSGKRTYEQGRDHHLRHRYGITHEQWMELLNRQNGKCAICETNLEDVKRFCVDHDHETNEVRGLVCDYCNLGMSHIDKPGWLEKALQYKKEGGYHR